MVVAGLPRHLARDQVARGLEVHHRELRLEQRGVHPLPLAGTLALEQREQDPEREVEARRQVRHRHAGAHRPLAGQPGDRHEPGQPLRDLIEARALRVRAFLAEARDAAVHDARVLLRDRLVVDAQAVLHVGAEVLDHDVRAAREPHEQLPPARLLQIQREAALVAVQVLEVEAVAVAAQRLLAGRRRALDLDHVRAPVGELAHGGGSGARTAQIQDLDSGERHARSPAVGGCGSARGRLPESSSPARGPAARTGYAPRSPCRAPGPRRENATRPSSPPMITGPSRPPP